MKKWLSILLAVSLSCTVIPVWNVSALSVLETKMLQDFSTYEEMSPTDQSSAGYAFAETSLTSEHTESGTGFKARWAASNGLKAGVHTFRPNGAWVQDTLANSADSFPYLRFWISNPSFTVLQLTVRMFEGETNKAYFDASLAQLIRKDGTAVTIETGNAGGFGAKSSMEIPSAFEGWVVYSLKTENTIGAGTGRKPISDFADVHTLEIDVRRPDSGDSNDYYVLDDICLSHAATGAIVSLEETPAAPAATATAPVVEERPLYSGIKNVIFLIGDGMGQTQIDSAKMRFECGFATDNMPVSGMVCTDNVSGELTDSGAAGTALSTGIKTANGKVAQNPDGEDVETLVEYFSKRKKSTGLVTTSYVLDATPATFGAHISDRTLYTDIAKDYFANDISVLLGGGTDEFAAKVRNEETGERVTLTEYAQTLDYTYVTDLEQLNGVEQGKVLGLFAPHYMHYDHEKPETEPSIVDMTKKAISLLSQDEDGFFLMVEAGNIDHAGHANELYNSMVDTKAFLEAVQVAMDFLAENPDTLIVVTGDHETGGLKAQNGIYIYTSVDHTQEYVPYYVAGKGVEYFEGLTDNTQISLAVRKAATELDSKWQAEHAPVVKPDNTVVIWIVVGGSACVLIVGVVVGVILVKKKRDVDC